MTTKPTDMARIKDALGEAVADVITSEDCGTCSVALVPDETTGFAYFHSQDTERAFHGKTLVAPLYIGFGTAADGSEAEARAIGRKIAKSLNDHGFGTEWDGTAGTRIRIVSTRKMLTDD